ncbi:MAG: EamA family transporter [Cyclobacteriaceae bacterium]
MDILPLALVLVSTLTHAYWNYLIKSSRNKHIFTALSKLSEVIIFLIPAVYFLINSEFQIGFIWLVVVAATITFLNYFFLASAYKHGELSLVYPISRSSTIFLPILAFYFIDEKIDEVGATAVLLILLGTFVMHMETQSRGGMRAALRKIKNVGSLYAVLAALTVAGYTLWDKISISKMQPFLYFYMYTFIVAIIYNAFTFMKFDKTEIKREWNINRYKVVQVGFFNSITYIMILIALTMSKVTYVGGLRQLSIVAGAFLGYKLLGEKMSLPKIVGILISLVGGALIYLAE